MHGLPASIATRKPYAICQTNAWLSDTTRMVFCWRIRTFCPKISQPFHAFASETMWKSFRTLLRLFKSRLSWTNVCQSEWHPIGWNTRGTPSAPQLMHGLHDESPGCPLVPYPPKCKLRQKSTKHWHHTKCNIPLGYPVLDLWDCRSGRKHGLSAGRIPWRRSHLLAFFIFPPRLPCSCRLDICFDNEK